MDRLHTGAVSPEVAIVADLFDQFCAATTFKNILGLHRNMCEVLHLYPTNLPHFYPRLKAKLRSWKAQALWKRLDARIGHKCYARGKACPTNRVLIIGAGPCGLRAAIEAQLLGAKVVVVEKRDRITRNNVLHLWPFVIQDLRALGAKKFFGKFCAGSIDHISIRQLQCILLKVALLLGVEIHEGVSFESLIPPSDSNAPDSMGWHAAVSPADHPVSQYEFDVLIGADGKRNTLDGFKRKEFRGKLAIAITANFINKRSEAEARVEEISGVAFIFNQKFFKDLYQETGIDLENIVYYKDDTHYFVMTAKKHSLIEKGVILEDLPDTARLLAPENVDREALMEYAREAAEFSTEYQMPNMEFAVNHYGQPDIAMFDFTSMYAAENASRVLEQHGHKLLMCLVGDSLLEPFWPTGSGCARGFLSSFDACWAIRSWGSNQHPLEVLAERESIYRLLAQTTPENLQRDCASYTLDPATRYPNLRYIVLPAQVKSLFQTDDPSHMEIPNVPSLPNDKNNALEIHKKRRRRDTQVHPDTLLHWLKRQVSLFDNVSVDNLTTSFKNGLAFCAIIHRYRPDLIDFTSLRPENAATNSQLAFDVLEREYGILPVMTGEEMAQGDVPDKLAMLTYLSQIYDTFRGEIPHVKHPKLDLPEIKKTDRVPLNAESLGKTRPGVLSTGTAQRISGRHKRHAELMSGTVGVGTTGTERRRKRRSVDKFGQSVEERQKRLEEIASNRIERMSRRKLHRKNATENFYKSIYMLQTNTKHDDDGPFEDYSIYLYRQTAPNFDDRVKNLEQKLLYPDRENHFPGGNRRGSHDEDFTGRIKNIEDKLKGSAAAVDKKPRDLLRAIGKIESSDWNIKEIEKKIQENKMGKSSSHEKERVPKWSREQFLARQTKMEKKAILDRQDSETAKYSEIDSSLKKLDQKLKEGTVLEPGARGNNKVAVMAEQFAKQPESKAKVTVQRSTSKAALVLPKQGGSESCHFCGDRVYLMERLSAEGKFFHRGCFRCQYCGTALRLGSYAYDREGIHGYKFYCSQHFGLQGNAKVSRSPPKYQERNKDHKNEIKSPDKSLGVTGLDLLDRGQTPERIDLVAGEKEEMDEDEWTDRNFGQSAAEADSDDSSDLSDSDSDDVYEEALEQGLEADFTEGTLRLADSWQRKYSARQDDDSGSEYDSGSDAFSYYDYSSEDDASDTATEGEDDKRARELRQQEVRVQAPVLVPDTDTGSDTEVGSEDTDSSSEAQNSATEISTDSEFEHDGNNTPTQEVPAILLNDSNVTKTRGIYHRKNDVGIKRVQVKSGVLSKPVNGNIHQQKTRGPSKDGSGDIKLEFTPLVPDITIVAPTKQPQPLLNPRKGDYLLSRTRSTEGIASKMSLELKKRYLLGNTGLSSNVKKCGSASALDSKFKSFHSNISEHQKLLNPAAQISPSMQAFLEGTSKLRAPLSPTQSSAPKTILTNSQDNFKHVCGLSSLEIDEEKQSAIIKDTEKILKSPEIIDSSQIPDSLLSVQPDVTRVELSKQTDETKENMSPQTNETPKDEFVFEADCRPRSPVHETSIIVPNISWNSLKKSNKTDGTDVESDSLSSSSSENISMEYQALSRSSSAANMKVPRLEIHDTSTEQGEIVLDSLNVSIDDVKAGEKERNHRIGSISIPDDPKSVSSTRTSSVTDTTVKSNVRSQPSSLPDTPKSLLSDPKTLNQPKKLAKLETETCEAIHQKPCEIINTEQMLFSEHSSTSGSCPDITAAVLTETELSDWARDGNVSDNIEDMEYKIDPDYKTVKRNKKTKSLKRLKKDAENGPHTNAQIAKLEDFDDIGHVCGKEREMTPTKTPGLSPKIIKHFTDLDSIEFMDTGSEESCLDNINSATNTALLKNRGYVQFVNVQNSYARPLSTTSSGSNRNSSIETKKSDFITEPPVEAINTSFENKQQSVVNTGYCIFDNVLNRSNNFGSEVIDLNPQDLKRMQEKREGASETEQDSLLIIESEEPLPEIKQNTLQDEQANYEPVLTEKIKDDKNGNEQVTKKEKKSGSPMKPVDENNCTDYQEHVRRLQQKLAEFSNVRDSIDIRKSKRKSKPAFPGKSEDIIEEKPSLKNEETRKLEEITKEREKRKDLIHEMVMDKLNAQKKLSGGKKTRRSRNTFSPMTGTDSTPDKSIDIPKTDKDMKVEELNTHNSSSIKENKPSNANVTPDILKINTNRNVILQKSPTESEISYRSSQPERRHSIHQSDYLNNPNVTPSMAANRLSPKRLLTVHSSFKIKPESDCLPSTADAVLLPNVQKTCNDDIFRTPQMKKKIEEAKKTTEKLREDARLRAQMKSDEDLGISPEDKIKMHRLKANKRYGADNSTSVVQSISVESLNTKYIDPKKKSMMLSTDSLYKHKTDLMSKQKRGELFRRSTSINEKLLSAKSNVDVSDKDSPKMKLATNKPVRTKSVGEISKRNLSILDGTQGLEMRKSQSGNIAHCKPKTDTKVFHKSESSLLAESKADKKSKCKDKERRKSIIQAVSGFFHKRKESSPTTNQSKSQNSSPNTSSDGFRDRLSRFRFSTKAKDKSKDKQFNESVLPPKSRSESCVVPTQREITPPPIPPPPLNYSGRESANLDDSLSEGEVEWKALDHSIETLDQAESSASTLDRKQRSMLRAARQSQQKRLRLAQEIQRKLEETEVKTRELEQIGVEVEKALRGEGSSTYSSRDESALLSEWLMLMRELAELRRYERELLDRAEELRLEERHARLQAQLQARLAADDKSKSSADVAAEGALLDEMLDIVSKRKSLIAQLEVDRQRYEEEDRDLEAQILSKGLRLTPFQKTPEK